MEQLLSDERVVLRPLTIADIDGNYLNWFNDPQVVRHNSHGRWPMTREKLEAYVAGLANDSSIMVFAVECREASVHVGNISLQNLNWVDRNAEVAFVLGETGFRGKGLMHSAGRLLISHAFNTLNLHRVYCGTLDSNLAMKRLAEKLGMKEEGRRVEALFKDGAYVDIIEYGLLRRNWLEANR
ncbi:GNAT family N-acetyltransferase [Alkalilimnicola sp. S0819]|uniref:GNAT family N-acetyltransferase n=1 Tax=Alkalilimnicola sp. S0819 TaxID=2613922 RepID=UPI001261D77B|nr:GNAT family N-acetyltransferase [Alkalilimnicola sp. S0819]KAB7628241.1 GNAT family N-acetyltransferase [Alkalilimnicola sp. S0819]MPQ15132.1 GNAT family N-acetyltransferase [Alkalilimnicola sp. S0819]